MRREGLRAFAKRVTVSHPIVNDIVKGVHQLTKVDTVEKLAAAFEIPEDELRNRAAAFAVEHPDLVAEEGGPALPPPGESYVERPARYSNFDLAAEAVRREGVSEEAIERTRSALKSDSDLLPTEWVEEIKSTARRMKFEARDPVGTARAAESTAAESDRLAAEAKKRDEQRGADWEATLRKKRDEQKKGK